MWFVESLSTIMIWIIILQFFIVIRSFDCLVSLLLADHLGDLKLIATGRTVLLRAHHWSRWWISVTTKLSAFERGVVPLVIWSKWSITLSTLSKNITWDCCTYGLQISSIHWSKVETPRMYVISSLNQVNLDSLQLGQCVEQLATVKVGLGDGKEMDDDEWKYHCMPTHHIWVASLANSSLSCTIKIPGKSVVWNAICSVYISIPPWHHPAPHGLSFIAEWMRWIWNQPQTKLPYRQLSLSQ